MAAQVQEEKRQANHKEKAETQGVILLAPSYFHPTTVVGLIPAASDTCFFFERQSLHF